MKDYRIPKAGECYRHFKGSRYQVLAVAKHTEREEELVIYQKMEGDGKVHACPLDLFVGKADKSKFPDVRQEYRFELEEETAVTDNIEYDRIMRFLDISGNEEKIAFLQSVRSEITDTFLKAAAQSLDFAENSRDLEIRYQDLVRFLKTRAKYEKRW